MSSFEILERYNQYSNDLISADPKVRISGARQLARLFWDAPELKLSIETKLEQVARDENETVSSIATQLLKQVQSGRRYSSYYSPYRQPATSTSTGATSEAQPQNVKAIVLNVVCCIVFIVVYFIISYVIF